MLGKLPVPRRPTILITVGQGSAAGGGCLDIFTLIYPFTSLSPSLWETARYRLKYCLKGPLNPKQPTNQPTARYRLKYCLQGPLNPKQPTNQSTEILSEALTSRPPPPCLITFKVCLKSKALPSLHKHTGIPRHVGDIYGVLEWLAKKVLFTTNVG